MAGDGRRSTAAQFFMDEDTSGANDVPTHDRVVELLNNASLMTNDKQKVNELKQVQELIIHKDPALLDNFLDEMLGFQNDRSVEVKRAVIGFMEEACKHDPEILAKVVANLPVLLQDENVNIQKRVILAVGSLYKEALRWIVNTKKVTDTMEATWKYMEKLTKNLLEMLDSENDGIRTHCVKFLESYLLTLTERTLDSEIPKKQEKDITLDQIPKKEHKLLKREDLEKKGTKAIELLLDFLGSPHISSINLMTCMTTLTSFVKQRPQFMPKAIQAFEVLHVNLPPTLAKSQVSSVRKHLKTQMLTLLKHIGSYNYQTQITTLLTDLGATQSEVMKAMPKIDSSRKRKLEQEKLASKKPKIEVTVKMDDDDDDGGSTPYIGLDQVKSKPLPKSSNQTAIDKSSEEIAKNLNHQNVADLVLLSMVMLPDTMPAHFLATYTPIAAAGTDAQVTHISRLLAAQLHGAGLTKDEDDTKNDSFKVPGSAAKRKKVAEPVEEEDDGGTSPKYTIRTVVGGAAGETPVADRFAKKSAMPPTPLVTTSTVADRQQRQSKPTGIKQFKLSSVTFPLDTHSMDEMALLAMIRILKSEKAAVLADATQPRTKILTGLVAQFGGQLKEVLQDFIFDDLRARSDLAFAWLYQEYAQYQGYTVTSSGAGKRTIVSYDECLTRLLSGLLERPDQREGLFSRLLLEAPCITENAIHVLKKYCQEENRMYFGMVTLKDLILKRPNRKLEFLDVLLDFCSHENPEVRTNALRVTKVLYARQDLKGPIEKYALAFIKHLLQAKPPRNLFGQDRGRPDVREVWTDDTIKICLYLYLTLLPLNHKLMHELALMYTEAIAEIKRPILRMLETPVKAMGMDSPELLVLVQTCPKGAETLVTRVIHILTDKGTPSPELVRSVRDLYQKRVSDVRFLIPVLTGLAKSEVISALPKLIKLNPVVVKEVFHRLLGGSQGEGGGHYSSPISPADLLVALHILDPEICDMKTIIKATNFCFQEKSIYTQEVLCIVLKQLMEISPIPTLLMRTVLQSLSMHPRIIGLVMNILTRLITKQVWKQKRVWEGFIKCCQRTQPQSYQVLLQLPAPQLRNTFETCPEMREPLLEHVNQFTPNQRVHIPKAILNVLERSPEEFKKEESKQQEEEERAKRQKKEEEERINKQKEDEENRERRQKEEEETKKRRQKDEADRKIRKQKEEAEKLRRQKLEDERKRKQKMAEERRKEEIKRIEEKRKAQAASKQSTTNNKADLSTPSTQGVTVKQEPGVSAQPETSTPTQPETPSQSEIEATTIKQPVPGETKIKTEPSDTGYEKAQDTDSSNTEKSDLTREEPKEVESGDPVKAETTPEDTLTASEANKATAEAVETTDEAKEATPEHKEDEPETVSPKGKGRGRGGKRGRGSGTRKSSRKR
ncbi:unnamed protein product [Owenia fusiformis]|uniref:Symplekin n=1 Tax=Owenia fusiformis TaxID=6347 RepID=A0A8S4PH27_OWEFU|nr:unnamed protein product [Owenia fusiformis]